MKLAEVLSHSRIAQADLADGIILIERATMMDGITQSYWYDIRRATRRIHSDAYGMYGEQTDLENDLLDMDIDANALDWHIAQRAIDFSDCCCPDCKAFCLENNFLPPGLPFYEAAWYWLCILVHDIRLWCYLRYLHTSIIFKRLGRKEP